MLSFRNQTPEVVGETPRIGRSSAEVTQDCSTMTIMIVKSKTHWTLYVMLGYGSEAEIIICLVKPPAGNLMTKSGIRGSRISLSFQEPWTFQPIRIDRRASCLGKSVNLLHRLNLQRSSRFLTISLWRLLPSIPPTR